MFKNLFCRHYDLTFVDKFYTRVESIEMSGGIIDIMWTIKALQKYKCKKCGKIIFKVIESKSSSSLTLLNDFINSLESKGYKNVLDCEIY